MFGVVGLKNRVCRFEESVEDRMDKKLKEIVEDGLNDIVNDIFSNDRDFKEVKGCFGFSHLKKTVLCNVTDFIISRIDSRIDDKAKAAAKELVNGEVFIDSIVDRIKKKQLVK